MFGVIGAGKMGMSIINGILKSNLLRKEDILVYDIFKDNLIKEGFNIASSVEDLYSKCDYILFSVKPQNLEEVLEKLKNNNDSKIVLSIIAGIPISLIKRYLPYAKIARIMPNTPALIGYGCSVISYQESISLTEKEFIQKIFLSIGSLDEVKEELIDEIIPINGSFPAYAYYFMKAFIKSAEKRGIDFDLAKKLVINSMIGSAKMIENSDRDIQDLINDVCSKGGTTIEGVYVFDDANLDEIVDKASVNCTNRSKELGKLFNK